MSCTESQSVWRIQSLDGPVGGVVMSSRGGMTNFRCHGAQDINGELWDSLDRLTVHPFDCDNLVHRHVENNRVVLLYMISCHTCYDMEINFEATRMLMDKFKLEFRVGQQPWSIEGSELCPRGPVIFMAQAHKIGEDVEDAKPVSIDTTYIRRIWAQLFVMYMPYETLATSGDYLHPWQPLEHLFEPNTREIDVVQWFLREHYTSLASQDERVDKTYFYCALFMKMRSKLAIPPMFPHEIQCVVR